MRETCGKLAGLLRGDVRGEVRGDVRELSCRIGDTDRAGLAGRHGGLPVLETLHLVADKIATYKMF